MNISQWLIGGFYAVGGDGTVLLGPCSTKAQLEASALASTVVFGAYTVLNVPASGLLWEGFFTFDIPAGTVTSPAATKAMPCPYESF